MSIFLSKQKVIKDWVDYNGHMNVAYYVLIFDVYGGEILMSGFNMGEESAKNIISAIDGSSLIGEVVVSSNEEVFIS